MDRINDESKFDQRITKMEMGFLALPRAVDPIGLKQTIDQPGWKLRMLDGEARHFAAASFFTGASA